MSITYRQLNQLTRIADVAITTWLVPPNTTSTPYHTRVHKIVTSRRLSTCEGGFAISSLTTAKGRSSPLPVALRATSTPGRYTKDSQAFVSSDGGISGVIGLYGDRLGKVLDVDSNSNLMAARTILPTLQGEVKPGTTWLAARVFAVPIESAQKCDWQPHWDEVSTRVITSIQDMFDELDVV